LEPEEFKIKRNGQKHDSVNRPTTPDIGHRGLFHATCYAPNQGAPSDLQLRYLNLQSQRIACQWTLEFELTNVCHRVQLGQHTSANPVPRRKLNDRPPHEIAKANHPVVSG
jgi:hypothetical protein